MEKKTNKVKLEIFKFLRKSALSQGYGLAYDKIGGNYALSANSTEFISAMKTVQNPTIFVKNAKE